jgi:hypothetical protein
MFDNCTKYVQFMIENSNTMSTFSAKASEKCILEDF